MKTSQKKILLGGFAGILMLGNLLSIAAPAEAFFKRPVRVTYRVSDLNPPYGGGIDMKEASRLCNQQSPGSWAERRTDRKIDSLWAIYTISGRPNFACMKDRWEWR